MAANREYFLHLVRDKHASYGVLNVTYCALKFIYNAVRIVMRSPLVASPANTLLCRLFAPHKRVCLQGGNEFVGRLKTSGPQFRGDDGLQRFQLDGRVGTCVHFGRLHARVAEPERDFSQIIGGLEDRQGARVSQHVG